MAAAPARSSRNRRDCGIRLGDRYPPAQGHDAGPAGIARRWRESRDARRARRHRQFETAPRQTSTRKDIVRCAYRVEPLVRRSGEALRQEHERPTCGGIGTNESARGVPPASEPARPFARSAQLRGMIPFAAAGPWRRACAARTTASAEPSSSPSGTASAAAR
jgi:hypothetical protein